MEIEVNNIILKIAVYNIVIAISNVIYLHLHHRYYFGEIADKILNKLCLCMSVCFIIYLIIQSIRALILCT